MAGNTAAEPEAPPESPDQDRQRPLVRLAWSLNGTGQFQIMFEGELADVTDNTMAQQAMARTQNLTITVPHNTGFEAAAMCILRYVAEEEIQVAASTASSESLLVVNTVDISVRGHDDKGVTSMIQGTTTTTAKGQAEAVNHRCTDLNIVQAAVTALEPAVVPIGLCHERRLCTNGVSVEREKVPPHLVVL